GEEPHIYQFVIRGDVVTGVYCRNCADATTIGFIDGTWDEETGLDFEVKFARPDGSIRVVDNQRATLVDGRLVVTGAAEAPDGKLTLVKDPRGAAPPAFHLPPGTPPAARQGGPGPGAAAPQAGAAGRAGGAGARGAGPAP